MATNESIWEDDHSNYEHVQAFAQALEADDEVPVDSPDSPLVPTRSSHLERTRKISALSDFAPINSRIKRRKKRSAGTNRSKQGFGYHVFRWPLLGFIFAVIGLEFGFYVFVRQIVNALEWLIGRGQKGVLRQRLRGASSYEEWKEIAKELDYYLGLNEWKKEPDDPFYDFALVKKVLRSLRNLRQAEDDHALLGVLEVCIRANFAGTESPRLYSETYYKTKDLLEAYVTEVEQALIHVRQSTKLSMEEKRKFFRSANTNLGASALCLSGGASFGYYHFGVVRAFLDAKMLPRVIAGTSAGGLIAALICTHTDEELRTLLVPQLADKITACEDSMNVWIIRFLRTGARFDSVEWAKKVAFFTRGSLTFREAYELTGRVLNVSVIPFSRYSPTKLLNYLTSPDCVIWSAVIASAAVPGILNPVVLMQKTKTGSVVPWNWGSRFKDGSLRVDIPLQSLNLLFNVNYPIVSQVNPHVHLFNFSARGSAGKPVAHRKGKGWRGGFVLSATEQFLKLELTKNFKVIRDLELLPQLLGQDWSSVFLQRFDGVVTIWPRSRFWDWFRLLTDPDRAELERMLHVGQIVTWPKLHMIENRYRLEREIYRGRMHVRQVLQVKDRDQKVTDGDQSAAADNESRAREPGSRSSSKGPRLPWISVASAQLPVESDAEAGYQARSPRIRQQRPSHLSEGGPSTDAADLRTFSSIRRRQRSSALDDTSEGEEFRQREQRRSPTGTPPSPTQSRLERTSSYLRHLRNKSFGSLSLPFSKSVVRSPRNSSSTRNENMIDDDERWSTDTDEEDDEVPWSGAMFSPKAGSRISLVEGSLGLGLSGDLRRPNGLGASGQDTLSDEGIDDGLHFGRAAHRVAGRITGHVERPPPQADDDV